MPTNEMILTPKNIDLVAKFLGVEKYIIDDIYVIFYNVPSGIFDYISTRSIQSDLNNDMFEPVKIKIGTLVYIN